MMRTSWPGRIGATIAAVLAVVIGLVAVIAIILYVTKGRFLKYEFESVASAALCRPVAVNGPFELYFNPRLHIRADDMQIGNAEWAVNSQMIETERLMVELHLLSLLVGNVSFHDLQVSGTSAALERHEEASSLSFCGDTDLDGPLEVPAIENARIEQSSLRYTDPATATDMLFDIEELIVREQAATDALVINGTGAVRDQALRLRGVIARPGALVAEKPSAVSLRLETGESQLTVDGLLPNGAHLEGANLHIQARGQSLQEPFALLGIVVPQTRDFALTARLGVSGRVWSFTEIAGRIGDSDMGGSLNIAEMEKDKLFLDADLHSDTMALIDFGPVVGLSPESIDDETKEVGWVDEEGQRHILPNSQLAVEALDRFDARVVYTARAIEAPGIPLEQLKMKVLLEGRKLSIVPLEVKIAGGDIAGGIVIDASQTPVHTDYDLGFSRLTLEAFFDALGFENTSTSGLLYGRIDLEGDGASVAESLATSNGRVAVMAPNGTIYLTAVELAELDPADLVLTFIEGDDKKSAVVRCGLVGFTIEDGVATADPIIIDTTEAKLKVGGDISFKTEKIDLKFQALAKDFSLFSAQSPIYLGGTLAEPAINPVSGELIGRTGAAVILGVAATPVASLLAFVDLGGEDNAACEPLLRGARAWEEKAARKAQKDENQAERDKGE